MAEALNPILYGKLKTRFGKVKFANQGEAMMARYLPSMTPGHRDDMVLDHAGEYYLVCCPFCSDTRHRLWINHMWGVKDKQGSRNLFLAHCYNEGCLSDRENREDLLYQLNEVAGTISYQRIEQGKEVDFENIKAQMPGYVERLDKLPPNHPANAYLAGRGYDPERLGKFYGVGYCRDSVFMFARNRIVVPIYMGKQLKGWQARYIGDLDWSDPDSPPKWFTMPNFKKGHCLYNYDNARKFNTGVVVEGCGDAWGFGPMSLGSLGDTLTTVQQRLLTSTFAKGSVVMLWDPEAMSPAAHADRLEQSGEDVKASKLLALRRRQEKLDDLFTELGNKFKHGFAPIVLPWGRDPGNLDRAFMRNYIEREAKGMGVKVSWKRK